MNTELLQRSLGASLELLRSNQEVSTDATGMRIRIDYNSRKSRYSRGFKISEGSNYYFTASDGTKFIVTVRRFNGAMVELRSNLPQAQATFQLPIEVFSYMATPLKDAQA